jgi:hypothetical protein
VKELARLDVSSNAFIKELPRHNVSSSPYVKELPRLDVSSSPFVKELPRFEPHLPSRDSLSVPPHVSSLPSLQHTFVKVRGVIIFLLVDFLVYLEKIKIIFN